MIATSSSLGSLADLFTFGTYCCFYCCLKPTETFCVLGISQNQLKQRSCLGDLNNFLKGDEVVTWDCIAGFGLLVLLKLWRREQQCLVLNLCLTRTWEALGFNEMEFLSWHVERFLIPSLACLFPYLEPGRVLHCCRLWIYSSFINHGGIKFYKAKIKSGFRILAGYIYFLKIFYFLFIFLRKINPELTSFANPPLFAEEDWPWANICAHLPLLYMWDAYYSMACQAMLCLHPGSDQQTRAAKAECAHLTAVPPGQPLAGYFSLVYFSPSLKYIGFPLLRSKNTSSYLWKNFRNWLSQPLWKFAKWPFCKNIREKEIMKDQKQLPINTCKWKK